MKKVITYGTYDLLTAGHVEHFRDAKAMGDYLIVGVSTDEFNAIKHKSSYLTYEERKFIVESIKYVDEVIPEEHWDQKPNDIKKYGIDIVAMGSDWEGDERFEKLREFCDVKYTYRSGKYSSTNFRKHVDEYTYDKKDDKANDDEFTQLAIKDMNLIASVKYNGYEKDIAKLKKLVDKWVDTNIVSMINNQGEVPLEESPMDELLKIEESINKKVKKHMEQNQKEDK